MDLLAMHSLAHRRILRELEIIDAPGRSEDSGMLKS
jgi:hypothetical protein